MTGRMSELRLEYDRRGRAIFVIELVHEGLHKHRIIRSDNRYIVQSKAAMQMAQWDEMWAKKSARDEQIQKTYNHQQKQALQKQTALERTNEATQLLDFIRNTLQYTLDRNDAIDWESLKDQTHFPEPDPGKPKPPATPYPVSPPAAPNPNAPQYMPQLSLLEKLFPSLKAQRQAEAQAHYQEDYTRWESEKNAVYQANFQRQQHYEDALKKKMKQRINKTYIGGRKEKLSLSKSKKSRTTQSNNRRLTI